MNRLFRFQNWMWNEIKYYTFWCNENKLDCSIPFIIFKVEWSDPLQHSQLLKVYSHSGLTIMSGRKTLMKSVLVMEIAKWTKLKCTPECSLTLPNKVCWESKETSVFSHNSGKNQDLNTLSLTGMNWSVCTTIFTD